MKKKILYLLFALLLALLCGCGDNGEAAADVLWPQEGETLATVGGKALFYDPVYLFDLMEGIAPEHPTVEEQSIALYLELAYLEAKEQGITSIVTDEIMRERVEARKAVYDSLDEMAKSYEEEWLRKKNDPALSAENKAELEDYYRELQAPLLRYRELTRESCERKDVAIESYWPLLAPYIHKYSVLISYLNAIGEVYEPIGGDVNNYLNLLEKYDVELVDPELREAAGL